MVNLFQIKDSNGDIKFSVDTDGNVPTGASNLSSGGLPTGVILMWAGLLANIPTGWILCNGSNGTPDLRSRFVKGAAAAAEAGSTGGATTHTHAAHSSHTHTYSEIVNHTHPVTDPGHTHIITSQTATTGGATSYEHGTLDTSSAEAEATEVTASATTGITTGNPAGGVASGTTAGPSASLTHDTPNSEPPFYTILFIMKT